MSTYMKNLFLLVMVVFALTFTGCSQDGASKSEAKTEAKSKDSIANAKEFDASMKELLEAMDYQGRLETMLTAYFSQVGYENQELVDEMKAKMPQVVAGIYSKHFSVDEIKKLTELNKDSIFKKVTQLQPTMNQEIMQESQAFVSGSASPNAKVSVSSEFRDAMKKYLEAEEYGKQMEQMKPVFAQYMQDSDAQSKLDLLYEALPEFMTKIYSKYFTIDDIKHLTELSNQPISKKFRQETPGITEEIMIESQRLMEAFMAKQESAQAQ